MKKLKEKLGAKLKKKNGFTLIEMLVVVAIIVILVMVSIPMMVSSLDKAKTATDAANLRAAKATATIDYLTEKTVLDGTTTTAYYNIKDGVLTKNASEAGNGESDDNKSKVIIVTVKKGTAGKADTIECRWDAPSVTPGE